MKSIQQQQERRQRIQANKRQQALANNESQSKWNKHADDQALKASDAKTDKQTRTRFTHTRFACAVTILFAIVIACYLPRLMFNPQIYIHGEDHASDECNSKTVKQELKYSANMDEIILCLEGAGFDYSWDQSLQHDHDSHTNIGMINGIEHPIAHFLTLSMLQHISFAQSLSTTDEKQAERIEKNAISGKPGYNLNNL